LEKKVVRFISFCSGDTIEWFENIVELKWSRRICSLFEFVTNHYWLFSATQRNLGSTGQSVQIQPIFKETFGRRQVILWN
jgi:hypothetical protein